MKTSFNGEEFAKALAEGSLKEPISLVGMVKSSEDPQAILFSRTSCQQWVSIPVEMIEKVEWLGKVPCLDHTHDYVRLSLKDAIGPVAETFAALLRNQTGVAAQLPQSLLAPGSASTSALMAPLARAAELRGAFEFDTIGTQPFDQTVIFRGQLQSATGTVGQTSFETRATARIIPGGPAQVPFFVSNLQPGRWTVGALPLGGPGPATCENVPVPGYIILSVAGGHGQHCSSIG